MTADHDAMKRICEFLSPGSATVVHRRTAVRLVRSDGATLAVQQDEIAKSAELGLVARDADALSLTRAGTAFASGGVRPDTVLPEGIGEIVLTSQFVAGCHSAALANVAESPLMLLRRRTGARGQPFLSGEEFAAGERLRADYTRGQMMPRLGANWSAVASSGRRDRAGGAVELSDAALAARLRVEKALSAVGPELSGVLVDICCYLKGLERVESERGWPGRSAKVVLKTALIALARYYDPPRAEGRRGVVHWGASDYRPEIGG